MFLGRLCPVISHVQLLSATVPVPLDGLKIGQVALESLAFYASRLLI